MEEALTRQTRAEQLTLLALKGITTITGAVAWIKASFVMEKWRAWVFLLLNLIMLAVLLSSGKNVDENMINADHTKEAKRIHKPAEEPKCDSNDNLIIGDESRSRIVKRPDSKDERKDEDDELNERVEAFIVMFRQHLVADAKITKHRQLRAVRVP